MAKKTPMGKGGKKGLPRVTDAQRGTSAVRGDRRPSGVAKSNSGVPRGGNRKGR